MKNDGWELHEGPSGKGSSDAGVSFDPATLPISNETLEIDQVADNNGPGIPIDQARQNKLIDEVPDIDVPMRTKLIGRRDKNAHKK